MIKLPKCLLPGTLLKTMAAAFSLMAMTAAHGQEAAAIDKDDAEHIDRKLNQIILEMDRFNIKVENLTDITKSKGGAPTEGAVASPELKAELDSLKAQLETLKTGAAPAAGTAGEPAPDALAALEKKLQTNINYIWLVACAALVFFMQAGFCMLETGMARAKNSINVTMKNFMDFCFATLAFVFLGFPLMFGNSPHGIIGHGPFWLSDYGGSSPIWPFWIFQVVFAGTATTIVSGAMAERTKFIGYVIFSMVFSALIYPVIGHWAWGGAAAGLEAGFGEGKGWLAQLGFIDFAGSSVVHAAGGAASLAGIIVLGPRIGRFAADGSPRLIPPHNIPMAAVGAFVLWFGWFGFNAGSTLVGDVTIGRVAANTTIAGSAGAIIAMFSSWKVEGRPDALVAMNGALAGLVAITACCAVVTPASAAALGCAAGLITTYGAILIEKLKLDDVVGAVPVHMMSGMWGTLCAALFNEAGFSWHQLGIQALGTVSIAGTSFTATFLVFKLCSVFGILRASEREQEDGLDFTEHGANAYADFEISSR